MTRRSLLIGGASAAAIAGFGALAWRRATGSASDYDAYARAIRAAPPPNADLSALIRFATLAANGHNTQPWRFTLGEGVIRIDADESRRTPVVDPDDHHLHVSLGCAAENLAIAARATGRPGEVTIESAGTVVFNHRSGLPATEPLFDAIPLRQSTRSLYDGRGIPPGDLAALEAVAAEPGVRMVLISDRPRIAKVRDLVVAGNDVQMANSAFMAELQRWIRFNPRSAMGSGDGLYAAASGNPSLPTAIGDLIFPWVVTAGGEREKYARQIDSSGALAVFVADRSDPAHWVAVGRSCQRFALAATARGLKHAFVNQPVEVESFRPELASVIGEPGKRPDLIMRLGYAPALPYSPRRPVEDVLTAA
ncbi:MAG: Tat pathway signal protein [Bauldia sp.]|nr:Tat pathway signal protein [Bauldia sp.]